MKQTMTRRFYTSRTAVDRPEMLKTLPEAIEAAKSGLSSRTGSKETIYIVEVVRIVKLANPEPPIEVIEVR